MSNIFKRAICSLIAFITIGAVFSVYALAATTVSVLNGQVSITDSATNMSESGGTVTANAKGGLLSQTTNTITITNKSGAKAELKFSYSASNYSSFSESSASGTYSVILEDGGTATMSIKGKRALSSNTATLKLSNFSLVAIAASSNVTFDYDSALGSVAVAGDAVSSGGVVNIPSSGATLVATPATGVKFLGWTDINGFIITKDQSTTLVPAQDMTVKAVFAKDGGTPWFGVGAATQKSQSSGIFGASKIYYHTINVSYLFDNLNNAAKYASANSSKYIVLMNSGTLPAGEYTIPAGVTLLVPYDAANTMYTTEVQYTEAYTKPTEYRTLTMAEGAKLVINGGMSISAMQKYAAGGSTYGGMPVGATGFVRMNSGSSITVNSSGALYAYGYVIGSGAVTAKSGSTVYEGFQIMDFRGGDQSTGMKNRVFPLSQYYVQNIEVPLTLEAGAAEYAYTWMYMSSAAFGSAVKFIGSDAMFKISSGTIKKYYDASTDRLMIEVDGDLSISSVSLSFASGLGTKEISSESYVLGLNGNISVDIKSGTTTVNQDIAMLPGAHMTIGENALVVIGTGKNMYVYDSDQWGTYVHYKNTAVTYVRPLIYSPTREPDKIEITDSNKDTRPVLTDATVLIKGTLDASKGSIYATESGAQITGSEGGKVITVPGAETVTYQLVQQKDPVTYDNIPITPVKLINADASIVETGNGAADIATTYTYTSGKWRCNAERHSYNSTVTDPTCGEKGYTTYTCEVCGDSYVSNYVEALGHSWGEWNVTAKPTCTKEGSQTRTCSVCKGTETGTLDKLPHTEATDAAKAPTCTETGLTEGKHCSVCNEVLVTQEVVDALGHTEVIDAAAAATCTETGLTEGKHCSVCSEVLVAQTVVEALGHTAGDAATCTTAQTCTVCGAELNAALGHDYDSEVTAPTCLDQGYTTHTCANCGDTYKDTYVDALGHSYNPAVTEPTCTEKGYTTYTCQCGDSYVDNYVEALGHTEVIDAAVAATCTETGLTAGSHCGTCGETIVAQEEVAALGHSYSSEVTAPTCLVDGYTTHTCATCGHSYTDSTDEAVGYHVWSNGACTACETPFALYGTNVALDESLDLYFYVNKADVAQEGVSFYAVLAKEGDPDSVTIQMADWEDYDATRYRFCYPDIPAKEMTDDIAVEIFYSNGNRVSDPNNPYTENVRTYAHNLYAMLVAAVENAADEATKDHAEQQLKTMAPALADMLNYGAACQVYFEYNDGDLANTGFNDDLMSYATTNDHSDEETEAKPTGTNYSGSTFSAKNELMYTFYFDFDTDDDGDHDIDKEAYAVITYSNPFDPSDSREITVKYADWYIRKKDNLCGIDVTGIPICWGRTKISCTVYSADGQTTYSSVTDSIVGYTQRTDKNKKPELYDVMHSLLRFVDSSNSCFNQ